MYRQSFKQRILSVRLCNKGTTIYLKPAYHITRVPFRQKIRICKNPVSILYKSIADRYRPVRVADGPITARCRFIKNASWELTISDFAHVQGDMENHCSHTLQSCFLCSAHVLFSNKDMISHGYSHVRQGLLQKVHK